MSALTAFMKHTNTQLKIMHACASLSEKKNVGEEEREKGGVRCTWRQMGITTPAWFLFSIPDMEKI